MEIYYKSKKLQKICESERAVIKQLGKDLGEKLMLRLTQLQAASSLKEILLYPPAGLHELKGQRKGQFAVRLTANWRLVFIPIHNPVPRKNDGSINLEQITKICIVEVVDYHGE